MASKESAAMGKAAREEKPSAHATLNDFLRKNRTFFIVLLVVLLAAVVIAAVWTIVDGRISASAAQALEKVEKSMQEWAKMDAGDASRSKGDELLAELDGVASKYRRRYAGQKSLMLAGRVYESREDWESAGKKYLEAADRNPKSFLSYLALQEAARSAEERQDLQEAIRLWKRFVGTAPSTEVGMAHAYFALGSIYEESRQYKEAGESYDKLLSAYPDNDWTKLARDRIILLKSQGLIQ